MIIYRYIFISFFIISLNCYSSEDYCEDAYIESLRDNGFSSLTKYLNDKSNSVKNDLSSLDEFSGELSIIRRGREGEALKKFNRLTVFHSKKDSYFGYDYNAESRLLGSVRIHLARSNNYSCDLISVNLDYSNLRE